MADNADSADGDRKMVFFREDSDSGLLVAEEGGSIPDENSVGPGTVRDSASGDDSLTPGPDNGTSGGNTMPENPTGVDPDGDTHKNIMPSLMENPAESDPPNGSVNSPMEDTPNNVMDGGGIHETSSPDGGTPNIIREAEPSGTDPSKANPSTPSDKDMPNNVRHSAYIGNGSDSKVLADVVELVGIQPREPTGRPRSHSEIVRDRALIADLYLRRVTQQEIADLLGLSQQTISNELKHLHGEWKERAGIDVNEARKRELATIDKVELEAWKGWLKSCGSVTERVYKTTTEGDGTVKVEKTKKVKELAGDKGFLDVIDKCVRQRCKILGVEAPKENLLEIGPTLAQVIGTLPEGTRAMVVGTLQAAIERDGDE